jgi:molecular chaperone GrpE
MPSSNRLSDMPDRDGITADSPPDIEQLQEQWRNEHQMYLRALADFDNFRRRVERERADAARNGKYEIIVSMLDALDGFDRAFLQIDDTPAAVVEGFQAIHRQLLGVLEAQGVTPFESLGKLFNPELHEAIGSVKTDAVESGVIVAELQRGYRWGEKVIRPARVRVAQ